MTVPFRRGHCAHPARGERGRAPPERYAAVGRPRVPPEHPRPDDPNAVATVNRNSSTSAPVSYRDGARHGSNDWSPARPAGWRWSRSQWSSGSPSRCARSVGLTLAGLVLLIGVLVADPILLAVVVLPGSVLIQRVGGTTPT